MTEKDKKREFELRKEIHYKKTEIKNLKRQIVNIN